MEELDESTNILKGNPLIKIYLTKKKWVDFLKNKRFQ